VLSIRLLEVAIIAGREEPLAGDLKKTQGRSFYLEPRNVAHSMLQQETGSGTRESTSFNPGKRFLPGLVLFRHRRGGLPVFREVILTAALGWTFRDHALEGIFSEGQGMVENVGGQVIGSFQGMRRKRL